MGEPFSTPDNKRYQLCDGVDRGITVSILFKVTDLEDPKFGVGYTEAATNARIAYKARLEAERQGLIERA